MSAQDIFKKKKKRKPMTGTDDAGATEQVPQYVSISCFKILIKLELLCKLL